MENIIYNQQNTRILQGKYSTKRSGVENKTLNLPWPYPSRQWAKSPKKRSVGVYFWQRTPSDCFFGDFAHWERTLFNQNTFLKNTVTYLHV